MSDVSALLGIDQPERKPTLVEAAYDAVKQAIRDGVFPPGFRGSEQEMAQRLGMSRTPVHQAIIRLQSEGMVELRAKRGVVISALSPDDMKEVYDVVIAVEGMAALLLAEQPSEARKAICCEMERLNGELAEALARDDLPAWTDLDAQFHACLVRGAGNGRLERIATVNVDQSFRARRLTLHLRSKPTGSIAEHQRIIDAIRAGEPAEARQMAQEHKIRARDEIVELLRRYEMKHL